MTIIECDVCHKQMPGGTRGDSPGKGVDYITFVDRDLCIDCYDDMVVTVRGITRQRDPFLFGENQQIYKQVIEQMCARGK